MGHRDRHGRTARTDGDIRRRPADGFRTADLQRFHRLVRQAVGRMPPELRDHLEGAALHVVDVPDPDLPADPLDGVRLASLELGRVRSERALTVYRRPLELRSGSRLDLLEVTERALRHAVQDALGHPRDED